MASKALTDLLDEMNARDDDQAALQAQFRKMMNRRRMAPVFAEQFKRDRALELADERGRATDLMIDQRERQQALIGESPSPEMPTFPVRTSGVVAPAVSGAVSDAVNQYLGAESAPVGQPAGAGVGAVMAGGGAPGMGTPTSTVTTTGQEYVPGLADRGIGSPIGNLLLHAISKLTGFGAGQMVPVTRTVNTYNRLAEEKHAREAFNETVDRVPIADAPFYLQAYREVAATGDFSPATRERAAKLKTYEGMKVDIQERGLAESTRHNKALELIQRAEAAKSGAASDAKRAAEETRLALLKEDYYATRRKNMAELNPPPAQFSLAKEMGVTAPPQLDKLQDDLSGVREVDTEELSPLQVLNFGERVAATNNVLTSQNDKLGAISTGRYMALMAAATDPAIPVTDSQRFDARKKLVELKLAEPATDADDEPLLDKEGNYKGIRAISNPKDSFSNYSGLMFDTYGERLRGSQTWRAELQKAGLDTSRVSLPGFPTGGPAAAGQVGVPPEVRQRAIEQQNRALGVLVPAIPESQIPALPENNPLRRGY